MTELRIATCCSSSSLMRSRSSGTFHSGLVIGSVIRFCKSFGRSRPSRAWPPESVLQVLVKDPASQQRLIGVQPAEAHVEVANVIRGGQSQRNVRAAAATVRAEHH